MKCDTTCPHHIHEKNDKFATCTLTNSLLPYSPGSMDNELPESCPNQKKKAWLRDLDYWQESNHRAVGKLQLSASNYG